MVSTLRLGALGVALSRVVAAGMLMGACGSLSDEVKLCGRIPEGGCPVGRGGTCDDTACAALYDCRGGAWTPERVCSSQGAGAGGGGGDGERGSAGGTCTPIALDHAGEQTGCAPDLQNPDCPAVAAELCPAEVCLTDCTDFFMCMAGGWIAVAYCSDEGELILSR